jgi:hypothetical protein
MPFPRLTDPVPLHATDGDPCAPQRRAVSELATRTIGLRRSAEEAARWLRDARRALDRASDALDAARLDLDPRRFALAKEAARLEYRRSWAAALTTEERRIAAGRWLLEIDRLNRNRSLAVGSVDRGGQLMARLQHAVDRLSSEADAARISAEAAEHEWREARLSLAACEERDDVALVMGEENGSRPLIFQLLEGGRDMLPRVGAVLAYDAGIEGGHTQLLLSELLEAINASALDAMAFDFPRDHPFWGEFAPDECHALTVALRSLGFAADGMGGWSHERVPGSRDLGLAIAHIGLDPRRLRHLPTAVETAELFRDVRVRSDRYLVGRAPDLSLTGMLGALGTRGDGLDLLWDSWGRLRPLLMTTAGIDSIE